ncbi:hypothetical protein [Pseudonocardia endophytica]|uniref:Magnesium transporter NIPA n=1 Tax=Pseudonocardia endophytica TaxID=401976 RepID=A0A4R1HQX1_PSEEN|nr:hypothetical protein [Pseudonocardia endophytica]TCK25014.1 hypothetical protein EV378_0811 [Pseudonocardia endophytica]
MNGLVAVAVVLAVTASGCFAAAAVLQHDAVRRHGTARAFRTRRWWTGGIAAGAGATGHATALALAPLAVVQPLGVLAVPLGVLFERRVGGRSGNVTAIACAVAGVVGGVGLFTLATTAAAGLPRPPADPSRVLTVVLLVALPALALAALSVLPDHVVPARLRTSGTARCLARAVPAAIAFGLVSAVLRAGVEIVARGADASLVWLVLVGLLALAAGGVGVQAAFRSGPPSLVVACLTVVDPIAAVGVGALALDERIATGPADVVVAVAGGLLAVAGVLLLARHHPDVVARDTAGRPLPHTAAPTDPIPPHTTPHTDPRRPRRPFPWRRP